MAISDPKPGDFFQSHYRAQWIGVLLNWKDRGRETAPLCTLLIVRESNGNRPRRKIIKVLDRGWLKPHVPVDIAWVNPFWFFI